jgi:hypothetical protein
LELNLNQEEYINKWKKYNTILYRKFLKTIGFTKDKTSRNLFKLFQFALYAIVIVFIINIFSIGKSGFGEWGDFFGGVLNPILTFLTFMGLLITIILQQSELKQSREEFKGQKESLENQEFDNKFFQMLNLLNNINDRLVVNIKKEDLKGKDVFEYLKEKLYHNINTQYTQHLYENSLYNEFEENVKYNSLYEDKFSYFKNEFNEFNNKYDTTFKYYFINLYQILKYIDTYCHNTKEAKEYTNMIRAQLTKNALILLAYNAIGVQNFTTNQYQLLVEKYEFFEHLRYDDFCENSNIIEIVNSILAQYDDKAFGNNIDLIEKIRDVKEHYIKENVLTKEELKQALSRLPS